MTDGGTARPLPAWQHLVTSIGWMSQALALRAAALSADGAEALALARAADPLDGHVLVYLANASAFTASSSSRPRRGVRHQGSAPKFVATFGQLYLGIFVLHGVLHDLAAAPEDGQTIAMVAAAALMGDALAAPAWVSVTNNGAGRRSLASAPGVPFGLGAVAPVVATIAGWCSATRPGRPGDRARGHRHPARQGPPARRRARDGSSFPSTILHTQSRAGTPVGRSLDDSRVTLLTLSDSSVTLLSPPRRAPHCGGCVRATDGMCASYRRCVRATPAACVYASVRILGCGFHRRP